MKQIIAKRIGLVALAGTIVPPVLFMLHFVSLVPMQWIMLLSCIVWFVTAPMWMNTE